MKRLSDHAKSKELVIFIANRLGSKENYGATVLNKALYFIDNIHYLKTGKPVSDFSYVKQDHGATPEPSQFLTVRDELVSSGEMEIVQKDFFGRIQNKLLAKRAPKIDMFDKEEIEFIDGVLSELEHLNATQVSDLAHRYPAWKAAKDKESLPLYTFLLSSKQPSQNDIDWAKGVLQQSVSDS